MSRKRSGSDISFLYTKQLIVFLVLLLNIAAAFPQSKIQGTVTTTNNKPVSNANVLLMNSKDSSLVKGVVTGLTGVYSFDRIPTGKYFIISTYTGLTQVYSPVFTVTGNKDDVLVGTLNLVATGVQLTDVKVTVRRPLLEQKIDRMVVNVANSITSAGNTALEVLERSPGVMVDHQNNIISMNGKSGVVLMMNGKKTYIPMPAAMQMLAGMSASNIEKIELINTPPANLDAEGNAGYIILYLKATTILVPTDLSLWLQDMVKDSSLLQALTSIIAREK
jgi:hypothetical protein